MKIEPCRKILVVCHDAGGAEVVSSWVRRNPGNSYCFVLEGPAVAIFKRKLGGIEILPLGSLGNMLVRRFDFVLTGTGGTGLENRAVKIAKTFEMPSASFLDHWSNYLGRFRDASEFIFPDEIWTGDERAYQIAKSCFGEQTIKYVPNPYFMDVAEEFARNEPILKDSHEFRILFLCEAISNLTKKPPIHEKCIEYECMDIFFEHLKEIITEKDMITVRLRLHPSEKSGKYAAYLKDSKSLKIELSETSTLVEDCVWADWVVGMNSMALIIAQIGGKRVFYCNLNGAKPKHIPTAGLGNFIDTTAFE